MRIRKRVRGKMKQKHFQCPRNVLGFELQVLGRSIDVAGVSFVAWFHVIRKQSLRLISDHYLSQRLVVPFSRWKMIQPIVKRATQNNWSYVRQQIMAIIYINLRSLIVIDCLL